MCPQARFVSKADVRHWPLLGWLVDAAGTLYIERERKRDAMRVVHQMAEALAAGDMVAVFPEGTTGDGRALLPFHANLLQAAIAAGAPVQPVALRFSDAGACGSARRSASLGDTTLVQQPVDASPAPGRCRCACTAAAGARQRRTPTGARWRRPCATTSNARCVGRASAERALRR